MIIKKLIKNNKNYIIVYVVYEYKVQNLKKMINPKLIKK